MAVIAGALLIGGGVFLLIGDPRKLRGGRARSAVIYALLTGTTIAAYTLWDKYAVSELEIHPLLLNWFAAKGELSSCSVEGMNTKAKVALRKSYGFKTDEVYEIVLYHELGRLPEHELAHQFC